MAPADFTAGPSRRAGTGFSTLIADPPAELEPIWGRRRNSDSCEESHWARKLIISFDGGGVRGYASLLILQALMEKVKFLEYSKSNVERTRVQAQASDQELVSQEEKKEEEEEEKGQEDDESEHASPPPPNRVAFSKPQERRDTNKLDKLDNLGDNSAAYCWQTKESDDPLSRDPAQKGSFRPHHYFDYFFGTSTGGLSAIMLGRLQMTTEQALSKYNTVATRVFQRRKKIVQKATLGGVLTPRFNAKDLEEALQLVTQRDRNDVTLHPGHSYALDSKEEKSIRENRSKNVRLANDNAHAARTAVFAYGGGGTGESDEGRMFRSYHHPMPNRIEEQTAKTKVTPNHMKHLDACYAPIWKVARATSAAPTYFSPIQIRDREYWDGGVAEANNPVDLAYEEIRQMHWRYQPLLIVSIGTGEKPAKSGSRKKWLFKLRELNNKFKQSILDSEKQHQLFQRKLDLINKGLPTKDEISYFRFNIPASLDITKVKLGEWEGSHGATTKQKLQDAVNAYLQDQRDNLMACAKILVDTRRERIRTERWERFAKHVVYRCPLKTDGSLCAELELVSRSEMRNHLIRDHGYVWKVPCKDGQGATLHKYSCFWDECGEQHVSAFNHEAEFLRHLHDRHGMSKPNLVSLEEFEEMLNRGRQTKFPTVSPRTTMATAASVATPLTMHPWFTASRA